MTPALLLPLGLAALAAVIVPLVIHIARRSEVRPTDFAALRWLRQRPKPRNRLRFDEWPLLIARLLLIVLGALWLARPVLFGTADRSAYVAVVPGALIEGVEGVDPKTAHWLAPGFPLVKTPRPAGDPPVASLIRQLDAELPTGRRLSIVTPGVLTGADAERPKLSRTVDWRVVAGAAPFPKAVSPTPAPRLAIRYDGSHSGSIRYLRAAIQAWAGRGQVSDLDVEQVDGAAPAPGEMSGRMVVWMAGGTIPQSLTAAVASGGTALVASDAVFPGAATQRAVLWRDALGQPLVEAVPMGRGRLMRFTRALTPSETPELLEPDFPARLKILFDAAEPAPSRAEARDYAPVTGGRAGSPLGPAPMDLRPWLAVLIALGVLGERWLATSRRRGMWP